MNISKEIATELEKSGWSLNRKIDTTEILNVLKEERYDLNPKVVEFIENFGNLELEHPAFRFVGEFEKMHFNPVIACSRIFREKIEEYEERTEENLVVIGEAYDGHFLLMISHTGKIYGAYDAYLALLGNSIEEALHSIFHSRKAIEIDMLDETDDMDDID